VFDLDIAQKTPELIQGALKPNAHHDDDAAAAVAARRSSHSSIGKDGSNSDSKRGSLLLLRVVAAADYHSHDPALMQNPQPVLVDLILDPYVLNVIPRSLLPTIGYLVCVGFVTWLVAGRITSMMRSIAGTEPDSTTNKKND
jgi:hypothetical protein